MPDFLEIKSAVFQQIQELCQHGNSTAKNGWETNTKSCHLSGTIRAWTVEPVGEIQCHVDGSWVFGWLGGAGFVFQNTGTLLAYCSERVTACCALQTEACALLNAMEYAIRNGFSCCNFLSDCQVLANLCAAQQPPIEVDWKAHKEIYVIWKMIKCN